MDKTRTVLTLAKPEDQHMLPAIQQHFKELLGEEYAFSVEYDPEIIGGFIANIGGKVYDASVRARLASMCDVLTQL